MNLEPGYGDGRRWEGPEHPGVEVGWPEKGKAAAAPYHTPQKMPPNRSQLEMITTPWMGPPDSKGAPSPRKGWILLWAKDMGPGEQDP